MTSYSFAIATEGDAIFRSSLPECGICARYDDAAMQLVIECDGKTVATITHAVNDDGRLYLRQHLLKRRVEVYSEDIGRVCGGEGGEGHEKLSLEVYGAEKLSCIGNEIRTQTHQVVGKYTEKRSKWGIRRLPYLEVSHERYARPSFLLLVAARLFTTLVNDSRLDALARKHDLTQYDKRLGMVVNEQAPNCF
ncbi:hypothetical protein E3P99_01315 [Wallemia hederae]|uniref:Uncharacterized protein n=1 Tax=Wallemia hederae TaxID=1540922 RepID=A0A4T0FVE1_9BASI|nr:hypothetical protein E3P99_01315 [Wallemia hederae]